MGGACEHPERSWCGRRLAGLAGISDWKGFTCSSEVVRVCVLLLFSLERALSSLQTFFLVRWISSPQNLLAPCGLASAPRA